MVLSSPSFGRLHLPARAGTIWASQVLWCFSSHMPRSCPTPADPRQPHLSRLLCLGFWNTKTIAVCSIIIDEAVSSFRECGLSYGLHDALCTLQPFRSAFDFLLLAAATLGTSGWLDLTRPGLSPGQKHQAFLGALVPVFEFFFRVLCVSVVNSCPQLDSPRRHGEHGEQKILQIRPLPAKR